MYESLLQLLTLFGAIRTTNEVETLLVSLVDIGCKLVAKLNCKEKKIKNQTIRASETKDQNARAGSVYADNNSTLFLLTSYIYVYYTLHWFNNKFLGKL